MTIEENMENYFLKMAEGDDCQKALHDVERKKVNVI